MNDAANSSERPSLQRPPQVVAADEIQEVGPVIPAPEGGYSVIYSITLPSGLVATGPRSFPPDVLQEVQPEGD